MPALRTLIVEDNPDDADLLLYELRQAGFDVEWTRVETEPDFLAELQKLPDIILSDYSMPQFSGLRALELLQASGHDIPLILISGTVGEETAVEAMRRGATDYLLKDRTVRLPSAVQRALNERRLRAEHEQAEVKIRRLNRLYAVSSSVNEAIVRIQDTPQLYEQACRIAVELGGLVMAWVGLVEPDGRMLRPVARWGRDEGYLDAIQVLATSDHPGGLGPAGQAFRSGAPACCEDIAAEKASFASQAEALQRGYRSCAAFPLKAEGRSMGVLVVYGDQAGYFDAEELQLLNALAENISFAVEANQREAQRQSAERALRASEANLANAQAVAKIGSWETDYQTLVVTWSDETHRIFETDPAIFQPTHESFLQFVHPEDRAAVNAAFVESLGEKAIRSIEHRLLLPDGRIKTVNELWQTFFDEAGHPVRVVGTCQDITERKRVEAEVRRTSELLRAVADGTPDAVFMKDLQGRYLLFNEAAARFVGRSAGEVLGLDDSAIFDPESARIAMENDRQVMESGEAQTTEEILTAAGATRIYQATKAPYRDGAGNVIGLIGISRDITERRRTEERFRWLVESNIQGVCFWKIDGRITDANDAFLRMVGYTREDLAAGLLNFHTMTPPEFAEVDRRTTEQLRSKRTCDPFEQEYLRKDGSRVPVLLSAVCFPENPEEGACFAIDLTERKKLEQQFLRAQRMEGIGTLAGGIAHDLNNVLGPVIMSLDLLKMKFTDPGSQELISIIGSSAQRGADMVQQVLSFARGVEGQRMEVQLKHLVRDIEKIANETFLKHIQVRTIIPPDLWTIPGDPTQLHQVLLNLCVNARDAMPNGGTLTISAENRVLDEHYAGMNPDANPGPYVFLQVEDTGTGIPPEIIEKIFDPFFTTKEVGKGTGLGLSTTQAIVKSHGGFLRVYSEVGAGTTFKVYLPAQTEKSAAALVAAAAEMPRGNGEIILVVDDETSVRQITQQTLEAFGYRALLAADGTEAVAIYARQGRDIAVVLTDMMMPVMDGPATIQVLRKMNPSVRIIAASGLPANGHLAHAAKLGIKHFLPKPFSAESLLKTLKELLSEAA